MSREDWVAIASRLFALFLAVTLLRYIPPALPLAEHGNSALVYAVLGAVVLVGLLLCALLWFFPLTVARKLLPVMKEPRSDTTIGPSLALSLGLTLLGVWMLTTSVPDAIYWAIFAFANARYGMEDATYTHDQIASMWTTAAELVLAGWLVFGSSSLRRWIERWRYAGSGTAGSETGRDPE